MDWKVIYVKPRSEKKVEMTLLKMGVKAYCPLVTKIHQWSDRKKEVQVPLLTSYVFVETNEKDRDLVFQVPNVVRYLYSYGKPAIARDSEIKTMQNWLASKDVQAQVEGLKPGDIITIKAGLFKGEQGTVTQLNKNRIQLIILDLDMKITLSRN